MDISDEQAARLGQLADDLDVGLYPLRMLNTGLDPKLAIDGMSGIMRETRDAIAALVKEITGEDPWEFSSLEG